jgi:hypothetical protein
LRPAQKLHKSCAQGTSLRIKQAQHSLLKYLFNAGRNKLAPVDCALCHQMTPSLLLDYHQ